MHHGSETKKKINPKQKATLFSLITFFFTYKLFKNSYKKDIEEADIYDVIPKFKSSTLGDKLEKEWTKEQEKDNPSIFRLLWTCYGKFYLFLGIIQLTMKILVVMIQPRALGKLVSYFTNNSKVSRGDAIYYAIVVISLNIINCTYAHNYILIITELGIRARTAFCSLIYRKSLKLTSSYISSISIGKIVTLVSKDVYSLDMAIIFLNDLWISVILLTLTSYLIYSRLGAATFAGILFLILIIPLQVYLGNLTKNLRLKASKNTDHRLQATQETLSAIKIIKMYTWEKFFGDKISKARQKEVTKIKQIYFAKATPLVLGGLVINCTLYIIVMTYTSLGNNFTAELAFFLVGCLQSLRSTVTISIPLGIAQLAELVAAARRIRKVLTAKESPKMEQPRTFKPCIQMEDVAVTIKQTPIINNINLVITSGFNVVSGKLGGGKSSLLKTILEDYSICYGRLTIQGSLSYASEQPWLFPSSIKQNILFGEKFDEERYKKVLHICALNMDFKRLPKGDETIVDDRGMNLSKGQQARINLARAVYKNSDIYLLDDCLSSLDTHVQDFVFKECIRNFLKDKIVLMISNDEKPIKQADNVIIMENGTIKTCLKPSEIPEEEIEELVREEGEEPDPDIIDNIQIDTSNEKMKESDKLIEDQNQSNIYHEEKKEGVVDFEAYRKYYSYGGSVVILILIIIVFFGAQVGTTYSDKLVSRWVNIQQNITEFKMLNQTNSTKYEDLLAENRKVMKIYSFAVIIATILVLVRAYAHFSFSSRASIGLHKSMVASIVNATMEFFDLHYIGNILNRFSKDLGTIDEYLPLVTYECLRLICTLSGIIILISIVNVIFLIPAIILFTFLFIFRKLYLPAGRSLKRLESATRSPVIGHLNASLEGLTTIRAYGTQKILQSEFDKTQDLYTSASHMLQCASRAFAYALDMLCNFFITAIVFSFFLFSKEVQAGNVGIAITQAFMLTGLLQWGVRQWAELENQMTSVERVLEYTNIKTESKSGATLSKWPTDGRISYQNVNLIYGQSQQHVLKNINFIIEPRQKIGIVGRTGAGKSSLISVLFRLYPYEGLITIDDVNIKTLSLDFVRSNIAIIPQDPILFTGTIRSNIDPTGCYKDEDIWEAINKVNLKDLVTSLDTEICENGDGFSSGQRQLICLARAIISKNKIIILDEATANVDPETDAIIYTTIHENFTNCTIITIAHRLHSVLYSDMVMVVDKGEIVEFDNPSVLLNNKEGLFYKMIEQANLMS